MEPAKLLTNLVKEGKTLASRVALDCPYWKD